jgi:Saxitoxin biosynthesis operon protein SxtJ
VCVSSGNFLEMFSPLLAARFDRAWTRLATMLGYVNSCLLLSAVFSLMVIPVGNLMRFFGRDPLRCRGPQQGVTGFREAHRTKPNRNSSVLIRAD